MQEQEVHAIVEALRKLQEEGYFSLRGLGRRLGISAAHLSMIFSGQRRPGIRFVRAVLVRFPELRAMVSKTLRLSGDDKIPH